MEVFSELMVRLGLDEGTGLEEDYETLLHVTAALPEAQRDGLLTDGVAPHPVGDRPIQFETVDGEHRITVPGLLEVGTERVPNPLPGQPPLDPKVSDLAVPFYTGAARVRRSTMLKLTDPDLSFQHSGRSSLIGQFDHSGP